MQNKLRRFYNFVVGGGRGEQGREEEGTRRCVLTHAIPKKLKHKLY